MHVKTKGKTKAYAELCGIKTPCCYCGDSSAHLQERCSPSSAVEKQDNIGHIFYHH
jgi:hypothetical protein